MEMTKKRLQVKSNILEIDTILTDKEIDRLLRAVHKLYRASIHQSIVKTNGQEIKLKDDSFIKVEISENPQLKLAV